MVVDQLMLPRALIKYEWIAGGTELRRRRERYRLQRVRETVEERKVRLARRREYYRRRRATISTEQREAILQQRRAAPTNTPWTVADEDATSCEMSIPSAS